MNTIGVMQRVARVPRR